MTKIKVDEVDRRFCEKYCCAWSGGRCWHTLFGDEWCLWNEKEIVEAKRKSIWIRGGNWMSKVVKILFRILGFPLVFFAVILELAILGIIWFCVLFWEAYGDTFEWLEGKLLFWVK